MFFAPLRTLCSESSDEDHTREDSSLWQWMICYAQSQCAAQLLIDILADELAGFAAIEKRSQLCQTAFNAMYSAAPHGDLQYCQTAKGHPGSMLLSVSLTIEYILTKT